VRCHTSIGVLGAASVAAGLRVAGGVGEQVAQLPGAGDRVRVEHPTGFLEVDVHVDPASAVVRRTAVVRTARKIFDGTVFPGPPGRHRSPHNALEAPMTPPLGDIAHVGHAQLFPPDLDASVAFFTDYLGLTVNFAVAGAASMVFIGIAALRTSRSAQRDGEPQQLATAG
jgi:hypothetical protein